jgi:TonB-dependent SusC/RagA subfamily outer membrane receptor
MRLRGVSSLSGNNQPLWIVDGVYISNAEIPSGARFASGANSGSEEGASNRIADLNPDDIESIEILKGASAAAIYGTRANAGVVIVTTKAGKSGKTQISLNQDLGFNSIIKFVGRRQYTAAEVGEAFGEEEQDKFEAAQAAGKIFDYEREIYGETGFIRDTKLKISGGNDKTNFFVSGSIRDEDGIIKNTGYVRNSLRLNLKHKITDDLDIQINANYVNSSASRSFTGNENEGGLSYGYTLAFTRDWVDLFPDADGNYSFNPNYAGNPIFVRDNARNEETTNRLITGVKLGWTIAKSDNSIVKFVANGGGDFFLNETEVYVPENHQSQIGTNNGFIGAGRNKFNNTNFQAFGIWDYFADSGISFSSQVGVSYLNFDRNFLYNQTTQLIPLQTNLSQGGTQEISQTIQTEEEFGFIAQEEINFKDRIIATVGVRFDKSSLNGDPNKYYAFPRASLAVNLGNFDFWNSGLIDQLKFRVAYGQTGSSAAFGSLFTSLAPVNIGGSAGFSINPQQGNPNLEPEKSSELEFGADVTFKGGKIGLEATYYIRNVNDLLYDRSLPTSSGFSNEIRNDLDLRNTGLELALKLKPISTTNLTWNTGFNFWFNRSEVTRLGVPGFVPPGVAFGLGLGTFFVEQDNPITALWGRDDEGNPTITGDTEPDFQLGWFNEVGIGKDLDFNFLVHWKEGGDVLNLTRLLTDIGGQTPQDIADIEGFIEDASYIRLREIGLYYTIPKTIKGLSKIKLGVSARNLLTITDYSSYDPETSTKGGSGLSTGIEVTPFPSSKQVYFHIGLDF